MVQYINEAYEDLLIALPSDCPYLNSSASFTLVAGTATYALASDATPFDLYDWALRDTTNNRDIQLATKEYVENLDSKYKTTQGQPVYAYPDSTSIGFYPVPNATATVTYEYGKSPPTRLTLTSATFIIPDRWVKYLEKSAEGRYKSNKGYGDADEVMFKAQDMGADILIEAWEASPTYLTNEGIT